MGRVARRDIVIPVRSSQFNPNLVMTLRTISKNVPYNRVWLAGHVPSWVSDEVGAIPVSQKSGAGWLNVLQILSEVARHDEVREDFHFFNDDFYVLKRQKTKIPAYSDQSLASRVRKLKGVALGSYTRGAEMTLEMLRKAGYDDPANFDLHVPMPMTKMGLHDAVGFVQRSNYRFWPHLRSVYGALNASDPVPLERDVKLGGARDRIPEGSEFASSSRRAFLGSMGRDLKKLFPAKCSLEKGYTPT